MAIIAELKRRNVFRVAVYYVALSWLVMQVTDVLMSVLNLPDWTGRLVFLLLVIGFPIALLLAWAFELTPEGLRRETASSPDDATTGRSRRKIDYLLIGIVIVVLAGYGWNHARQRAPETVEPGQIHSVVVLPFENLMNDPDQDYFVEGMHDALITQLSKINSLHTISRTTAMHYAGSDKPVPEIAHELKVDAVVQGSVLREGDTVRITAQLIDAQNDRYIWAGDFDRKLANILALYSEVTREIASQVRATVTPDEQASLGSSGPIDPKAYELYLKGRYLCGNWSPREMRQGAESLSKAIQLAPDYGAPYAQLAMCLVDSAFFEFLSPAKIDSRARAAAMKAVQLSDSLAEAHVALGSVHYYLEFDPESAEHEYLKALALNPNSVDTLLRMSWLYAESGRFDEAYRHTQRAVELDPLSTTVRNAMGQVYYLSRQFDLAVENFEEALNLDQSDPSLHYYVGLAYEQMSQFDKAIAQFESARELSEGGPLYLSALGHAYGQAGMREQALQILETLRQAEDPSPFNMAIVYLGLGDYEQALDLLENSFATRNMHLVYVKSGPRFDPLRGAPRFDALLERMGW
jgi:TolB-like protein/Flp pilus assembly protein TadD